MAILVIRSWLWLAYIDLVLHCRGLGPLYETVRSQEIAPLRGSNVRSARDITRAIDLACVFYFKQVLCLQRAVATTIALRRSGYRASMIIGGQSRPAAFHAWVEIDDAVINDKPYMREIYKEMQRC